MKIWIDSDACPRDAKDLVFKASARLKIPVVMVANSYMQVPDHPFITFIQVDQGADVADLYIVEHLEAFDLVITADIPLANLAIEKKAVVINPRGELYTSENIKSRLSVRDFMSELRDGGVQTGGPAPYGDKDKQRFANTLNQCLAKFSRN